MRNNATVTNLSRYQRRKEKTKQDILAAARKVLAEKGYHNAKIIDIAAAAELIEETARLLKEDIDRARSTVESPIGKLRAANLAFFSFAQENRDLLKIVFGHGNTFNELLRRVYAVFISDAAGRVTEGIDQAEFRSVPSLLIANALVGMSAQVVSWWIDQAEPSAEEMAAIMTDFVLRGIACTPAAP